MEFGTKIKDLRIAHDETLSELGSKINFNYSNLSKIERGERKPTIELLEQISRIYNVPISFFFKEEKFQEQLMDPKWLKTIDYIKSKGYEPEEVEKIIDFIEIIREKRN